MPEVKMGNNSPPSGGDGLSSDQNPVHTSSPPPLSSSQSQPLNNQSPPSRHFSERRRQSASAAVQVPPAHQTRAQSLDWGSRSLARPGTFNGSSNPPKAPWSKTDMDMMDHGRRSVSYSRRATADAYYDSRAGTHREWKRRAKTLQEYYDENPRLLPQLPFTWHHGRKRWRLFFFAFVAFVDASVVPITLYYAMNYAGHTPGWIIFAIVTTIWGGPAYFEAAMRTLRLIKKERFFRPLGTDSRWSFDILTWISVLTIGVVTALFIVGSAPHIVFLRVLSMPGPAILYCLGGSVALITLYHAMGWKAPFRISSTMKGEKVLPGVYYLMEDVVAVNAGAGRPYREALAARYQASVRFQRMVYVQSLFWSIPALILAVILTVVAVIPPVPPTVAYGICWAVPFLWAFIWVPISIRLCKNDLARERVEWESVGATAVKLGSSQRETSDTMV